LDREDVTKFDFIVRDCGFELIVMQRTEMSFAKFVTVNRLETTDVGFVDIHSFIQRERGPTSDDIWNYARGLEKCGKYNIVVNATTPMSLLNEICKMGMTVPDDFIMYVMKYVGKDFMNSTNQWNNVILPYMNVLTNHVIQSSSTRNTILSSVIGGTMAMLVTLPYKPTIIDQSSCGTTALELKNLISQGCAYVHLGLHTRGSECGRWATRLTPEGFSFVLAHVNGSEWKACQLPNDSHRCVLVTRPSKCEAWFFKINGCSSVPHNRPVMLDAPIDINGDLYSVFECTYNPLTDKVTIYDCAVIFGQEIRNKTLTERIRMAKIAVVGWKFGCNLKFASVADYGKGKVNGESASMILFVRDAAPLNTFAGGDAYVWKVPTLIANNQKVMIFRLGECMAAERRDHYMLRKVGDVFIFESHGCKLENMHAYVFERDPRTDAWRAVRPAKNAERLFTYDECISFDSTPTQITRNGVMKLLNQISDLPHHSPSSSVLTNTPLIGNTTPISTSKPKNSDPPKRRVKSNPVLMVVIPNKKI
jgi:hypothetical protein